MPDRSLLRISADGDACYVVTLLDVAPTARDDVIAVLVEGQSDAVAGAGDLTGAVVLASDEHDRVATLTRWKEPASYATALHCEDSSGFLRRAAALAKQVRAFPYSLFDARSRGGANAADVFPNPDHHCCVICARADDQEKRDFIVRYNVWETDRYIATMKSFRFAAFFVAYSPTGFGELTQWESTEEFHQAWADPGFQEHLALGSHYTSADVSFHRVVAVAAV